ncbi:MAG TPA: TolC family protein [Pyrinomonadaceae bacterium]|nr:TolC family protein [Pyrinomonadaceae bacterium]
MFQRIHSFIREFFVAALLLGLACAPAGVYAQQPQPGAPANQPFTPAPSANTPQQQVPPPQQAQPPAPGAAPAPGTSAPTSQTPSSATPTAPFSGSLIGPASPQPEAPSAQGAGGQQPVATTPGAQIPGSQIPSPAGVGTPGRESVPTAAPGELPLVVPPVATDFRSSPAPFPVLERVGVSMGDQRTLGMREAIEMALANNKDIEVARTAVRAAEFDLRGARGVYDPRFTTNSYSERTETPAASLLSGSSSGAVTQSGFFSTSSFQGLVPKYGGGYRVDFTSNRVTTNSQFAALNPQYPTALSFSYTQPILRGREFDQNRRLIEIARRNLSLTDAQFRQRAIETITNVQRAYWDLVFALRNLQIQRDAVRDARAQLEHNRRLVVEGFLAPIDVVAAEAQVSGFEQSVYSALDDVGRAENVLKNLIAENREAAIWNVAIVPTDSVDLPPPSTTLQDAMRSALKGRPELQASDVAGQINEIEQRFAREQTRPQVDLIGSYGMVGLSGALSSTDGTNPFTASNELLRRRINELSVLNNLQPLPDAPPASLPGNLVGGYAQSLGNLAANRFTNFRVGVAVNLPLRNTTAEAQLGRSLVEGERIRVQREQLEQLIQVDVRNALQLVHTAESRLRAAASARSASEQQYASEQRKLDVGQSTVFLVLERQTALATARGNELRAQTELNKAIAELQRATGNSLEENRVEVRVR